MRNKIINIVILLVLIGVEIYNFKENFNRVSFDSLRSNFWLIHMGVSTLYIALVTYFLKIDLGYYDLLLFFLPLIGVCILLCELLFSLFKERIVNNIEEAYDIEKYVKDDVEEELELQKSLNTIAAYDSLTVKTIEEKKKFIFEFNPPNMDFKIEILERALKDKDINVIHYAAVELNRIDVEFQKNIKDVEKSGDRFEIFQAYKEYINSGILKDFMLTFYLEKSLNLLLELISERKELRVELLSIYEKLERKREYENLLQTLIDEQGKKELVELMLNFLYRENRYEEMLAYQKRFTNLGIVLPEVFSGEGER